MFGKYIEELMLLPVLKIAILKNCNIKFDYIENGRNKLIGEFLSKIADKKLCLSLDRINSLKNKFSMLPVEIIEKTSK